MPFKFVADVSIESGRKCVLLERTVQPSPGPWIGAFFYAPKGAQVRGELTVSALLDMIQPAGNVENLGFLIVREAADSKRLAEFTKAMLAAAKRFPLRGQASVGGFVLWLDQLGAFELGKLPALSMPRDPVSGPAREGPTSYRLEPNTAHRLWDPTGTGRLLSLYAPNLRSATLGPKGDDGIAYVIQGSLPLRSQAGAPVAEVTALSVDFVGARAGCAILSGAVQSGFRTLEPGFQHELQSAARFGTESTVAPGRLYHPLLDPAETLAGASVDFVLDPLAPADPARNTFVLKPAGGSFASAYRTRLAEVVRLAPGEGTHFQAATSYEGRIYFAPAGSFALSVADGNPAALLGGLSGVEYLRFATGDQLIFAPGQNASVDYDDADGLTFASGTDAGRAVSWAALLASSGTPQTETWVSESERSPFFASATGNATSDPLGFLPVAQRSIPIDVATAIASPYPLLPYAALGPVGDGGPGDDAKLLRAFELSYISPRRRDSLLALTARPSGDAPAELHALTPQGYVAILRDGRLTGLTLGQITRSSGSSGMLRFDAGTEELPAELRDAFFANQQFIVITAATPALGQYEATCNLSGWTFNLELPAPDDVVPGDYRTVLIIKSAGASIEELAAQTGAWTGYAAFNNTELDPTGETLSAWLSTYIADAKAMYDGGNGVVGLQTFVEIVSSRSWNGFVFLRVPVDTGALDPAIQFLLTGVDRELFNAHHLGCAVNHASVEDGVFKPNSAYFGLVHYVRPGTDPGRISSNGFVPSTIDYDFQLLLLDTTFESSAIASFSSTARLILNRLFGDAIASNSPDPATVATNALLVYGSLQLESGVPRYTFATGTGQSSTLFPISAGFERIEIDRARMSLDTGGGDDTDVAYFNMSGWFALGDRGEGFDLLSYAGVGFANLILVMTFPVGENTSRAASYVLDTTQVTLAGLPERVLGAGERVSAATVANDVIYRAESLASQLPVTATRLITGAPGGRPLDLGYGELTTTTSTGTASYDEAWYALELALPLGSAGALGSGSLLAGKLLFAWSTGGSGPAYQSFFKLEGPGGATLAFEVQGVLKLGADAVVLTRTEPGQYVISLSSIGLTVLTKTFPPAGTTNIYLAGFSDGGRRTLGWFGAYVAAEV